jgi:ComF family protein
VPVGDFEAQRDSAIGAGTRAELRDKTTPPRRRAQAGESVGRGIAAELAQLEQQRVGARPRQRERLLIHDRIGEAAGDEHVTEVMHVDEARCRGRPAHPRVEIAQLAQAARPEARQHDDAIDIEQPMPAREQGRWIDDTVQHHVRPDQLGAADGRIVGVGGVRFDRRGTERPPGRAPGAGATVQPSRIGLDGDDACLRIARAQHRAAAPEPGPPIENSRRLVAHRCQPFAHPARDFAMQPGRLGRTGQTAQCGLDRHGIEAAPARAIVVGHGGQYIETMLSTRLPAAWRRLSTSRWPSLCAVCHGWGAGRVCAECASRVALVVPRCQRCALPVPAGVAVCSACLAAPPDFDTAFARVDYGFPWDRLIAAFKFHGALDLAPVLAAAIVEARRGAAKPELPWLIVPVPLSEARLRERGYNQAWELARRVARRIDGRADARLVLRIRDTPHQLTLPPDARAGNVRGAFAVEPRRIAELRGRAVAVVDDVMTTGSTVAEIARVLKQAGAARVEVWVVARTPRPEDE